MNIRTRSMEIMLAEREMTKAALAEAAGTSRQSVSAIMRRGTCEPRTAGKLAAALGVSVCDLVGTEIMNVAENQ